MATQGRELLGGCYDRDRLTHEGTRGIGLRAVTEDGEFVPGAECQDKVFRFANGDDASGYLLRSAEETGASPTLNHPRRA